MHKLPHPAPPPPTNRAASPAFRKDDGKSTLKNKVKGVLWAIPATVIVIGGLIIEHGLWATVVASGLSGMACFCIVKATHHFFD